MNGASVLGAFADLLANGSKMRAIAGVPGKVDPFARKREQLAAPKRPVAIAQASGGPVLRG